MYRAIVKTLLAAALPLAAGMFGSQDALARKTAPKLLATSQTVKDLYYGDVLFYFYQDDYFQALTRVDAALEQNRLNNHVVEAKLLRGGLYLSMGQHAEAGKIFKELLNDNVPDDVRNRAWFYLATVWYQRGYYTDAELALNSIAGRLSPELESERQLLHAEVLLGQGKFADAAVLLGSLPSDDRLASYVRFNLGVALVREQRIAEAAQILDEVGQMDASTEELASLRDKANLALGFAFLKAEKPDEAAVMLERVRLRGPNSNKALLGMGWAGASQKKYKAALTPWMELHGRGMLDAAVQESYLAVPYAYTQLSATRQAAEQYANAIQAFSIESARIDESIVSIRNGGLIGTLLQNDAGERVGWYWQLQQLPDAPETRYLYHLLATHEFQEALKNYRDLHAMQRNMARWTQSSVAFQDMIDTRREAYKQRVPKIDGMLNDVDLDGIEARRVELASKLAAIERDGDVVGLATESETDQWNKVLAIEAAFAGADPDDPETVEMRQKLKLIRGVLYWNMNAGYKARLWRAHKEQRELEVIVKEARRRWTLIERARNDGPKETDAFAARVQNLQPRIVDLVARLDVAAEAQNKYLADVAIKELEAQKERLAAYGLQAQFALATIYDRATSGAEGNRPAPAAPSAPAEAPSKDAPAQSSWTTPPSTGAQKQ